MTDFRKVLNVPFMYGHQVQIKMSCLPELCITSAVRDLLSKEIHGVRNDNCEKVQFESSYKVNVNENGKTKCLEQTTLIALHTN